MGVPDRIVIYGAGAYARSVYTYLNMIGVSSKIDAFIVSDASQNEKTKYGVPVVEYGIADTFIEDSCAYIAISGETYEIYEQLKRKNAKEIITVTCDMRDEIHEKTIKEAISLPISHNIVFVDNYFGMGYKCNCKYIAKYILQQNMQVRLVWDISNEPDARLPEGIKPVLYDTPEYYKSLYTARVYLTNCGPRSFFEKRPGQYVIDTWHGTGPFKKAGMAVNDMSDDQKEELRNQFSQIDLFISNSKDNTEMYRESFEFKKEIYECGYPRNDIFFDKDKADEIKARVLTALGIKLEQKIVLYVPTFREIEKTSVDKYDIDMERAISALEGRFGGEFILLYRFHHRLYQYEQWRDFYPFGIDVTLYDDIQELMLVADVLITDYSSAMWDFSLMRKPVFLYQNDEEEYLNDRGFYWLPSEWPYPRAHTSEEMAKIIESFDDAIYQVKLDDFFRKDPSYDDGHASERVAQRIMDVIEHPERYSLK